MADYETLHVCPVPYNQIFIRYQDFDLEYCNVMTMELVLAVESYKHGPPNKNLALSQLEAD